MFALSTAWLILHSFDKSAATRIAKFVRVRTVDVFLLDAGEIRSQAENLMLRWRNEIKPRHIGTRNLNFESGVAMT